MEMKEFNVEEYLKDPSRKVVTRDERAVEILCTNYIGAYPIIAQVEGYDYSTDFCKDGRAVNGEETPHDLFFAPEKKEGWVNVYQEGNRLRCGNIYDTKSEAEQHGSYAKYIATAKIEWEE